MVDNLQPRVAAAILRLISSSARSVVSLGITNCSLSDVNSYHVPTAENLKLEDIGATDDLRQLLWGPMPRSLMVTNCASFTSQTMDKIFSPRLADLITIGDNTTDQIPVASIRKLLAAQLKEFDRRDRFRSSGVCQDSEIKFERVQYHRQRCRLRMAQEQCGGF